MISNRCKYALKALIYIARQEMGKSVLSSEIAKDEHIPKKFLENILRDLKNAQFLTSKRGAKGGYKLNKGAEEITLIDIIRLMDGPIALIPCVSIMYNQTCDTCKNDYFCTIKETFAEVRDATLKIYEKTTLASLARKEKNTNFVI
ncbi:Rrf2 family transcriptional regulator [Apibacter muscae]|uniref:Rrf2 family transcriptional regulator n=1 Tax=Apibacter muscae TaxID=2509004 RepID=A0A563DIJ8_9FLAO|nr:Rrf2 family transcriptional regulator [Apibacter muscae]TWP24861.1 Rrf2 family transcriptional regulator [Apibacter muscae]TWP29919.1 Rrf2 family transcriptional regulator [Apibacter muscae]TWP31073.1 Rrf2 family transcriptional regulator [Apibacter muscae]